MSGGLIFYWLAWIFWVIVTFMMTKNRMRTLLACWILVMVLVSDLYIAIASFQLSASYLIMLTGTVIWFTKLPHTFYHVFVSFTLMIGYSGILIWNTLTPLRHFIPELLMITIIMFILITLLTKAFVNRLICGLFGILCGELVYSIIMAHYQMLDIIGDLHFLDAALLIMAALCCQALVLNAHWKMKQKFYSTLSKTNPVIRKQAQ